MVFIIAGLLLLWLGSSMLREFSPRQSGRCGEAREAGRRFRLPRLRPCSFFLRGRIDLAFGLAGLGFWLTTGQKAPNWSSFGRAVRGGLRSGRASRLSASLIEMELDHATGAMRGMVLAGPFAGRSLDDLDPAECESLHGFCRAGDAESARLLEAYLDRRFPGWRAAAQDQRDPGDSDRASARAGTIQFPVGRSGLPASWSPEGRESGGNRPRPSGRS